MAGYSLGIDFGTCSIKIANYEARTDKVNPLKIDKKDNNSKDKVSNVIAYSSRNDYFVGDKARKTKVLNPSNVVEHIKRKLEMEDKICDFPKLGFSLSACQIAEDIFKWLKKSVENLGREIEEAVITVPVCFSEVQKNRIINSAKEAGINVVDTITEPVAALFSIDRIFEEACNETIVIFDFGGASLDLCLVHVENDGDGEIEINVEASAGMDFGGVDITKLLYNEIIYPKYKDFIDSETAKDKFNRVQGELIDLTENMKMELFENEEESSEEYYNSPNESGASLDLELTIDEVMECFEKHQLKEMIIAALDDLFEDSSNIDKDDVSLIKTSGGTSGILYVRELLAEYFGKDVEDYDSEESYLAVSKGAAKYLNLILDETSKVRINNALPFYVGVNKNHLFKPVVKRNQKYGFMLPYKKLSDILDSSDNEWKVSLYQSFKQEESSIDGEKGAVYLGKIPLQKDLYTDYKPENLLYKFGINRKGKMTAMFFGTDSLNEPMLIEEKEIVVGG